MKINKNGLEKADLKSREKKYAITDCIPSFFDYWSYMYFCGAAFSGPWYEFRDFQKYMRGESPYSKIPSTVKATLERIFHIVVLIGFSVLLAQYFDEKYYLTNDFKQTPFLEKVPIMIGTLFLMMSSYVTGFCFLECGVIASGFSYNDEESIDSTTTPKHDKIKSVLIKGLLTSYRVKDFLASWNISVHEWLKYYVYLRLLNNKKRGKGNTFAALASFMVSAIWHGFYPGFYCFFTGAFIMDYWNKLAATTVGPYFGWIPEHLQNIGCTVIYYIGCAYFAIGFVLLNFCDFHPVYMSMGYGVHVFFVGTIPLLHLLNRKPGKLHSKRD